MLCVRLHERTRSPPCGRPDHRPIQSPIAEKARLLQQNQCSPCRSPAPWANRPPPQTKTPSPRGLGSYKKPTPHPVGARHAGDQTTAPDQGPFAETARVLQQNQCSPCRSPAPWANTPPSQPETQFAERARLLQQNQRPPCRSPAHWANTPPPRTKTPSPRGLDAYKKNNAPPCRNPTPCANQPLPYRRTNCPSLLKFFQHNAPTPPTRLLRKARQSSNDFRTTFPNDRLLAPPKRIRTSTVGM